MSALRHVLKAEQFDWPLLESLFGLADRFRLAFDNSEGGRDWIRRIFVRRMMFYIFFAPSTRTRLSFCSAAFHLGMTVEGSDNAGEFSSFAKQESMEDAARVLSGYRPDLIVIRSKKEGEVTKAANSSLVPIINAGDGSGEHPTQALLDLYTLWRKHKTLEGLHIVLGGDLERGRTVRSLVRMLLQFDGVRFTFISPEELKMKEDITNLLDAKGIQYKELHDMRQESFCDAHGVYWTRSQNERPKSAGGDNPEPLVITQKQVDWCMQSCIFMHPLPRTDEIDREVDSDPRIQFFDQSDNGMWLRMALIYWVITGCTDPK